MNDDKTKPVLNPLVKASDKVHLRQEILAC